MRDADFMRTAVALGRRALGTTWPNPAVGCVLVRDGAIIAQGQTAPGGRPHAETAALAMAGPAARGATAYVTLEPCSHHGETPPCADALIAAGVARVVVALGDPDPRVNGAGIARLRDAGIEVTEGVLAAAAAETLAGFLSRVRRERPLVTLKLAATLDGRIATSAGESQWITDIAARKAAHALRGQHDAVLVGVGTVLADDPDLTCRIQGFSPRPAARVVADSHLRTPLTARAVATSGQAPTWILHRDGANPARVEALTAAGVRCLQVPAGEAGIDPVGALAALGQAGLTRVLAEGGARLAASLLRAGLVDRLCWFVAPGVIGGDGWPAVEAMGVARLADMHRFRPLALRQVGPDLLAEFARID
ncbi:MAG TPA: bifunctional diaminohydroxyphosphoribosylaminopyrimidine deaminase/5-amino-6-(5-phosphoribosylamino)uracil reductase RibD [Acetobacteraceae bacterium]|nr:bifunctional diaminohydroxyphosphoribosylaminopyrimidine deaminase/5-amino-6-(5-phosphoribosylamino)uracil reductase RibD [Acetobacteraceae bacterium]